MGVEKISNVGEYIKPPRKNPPQVEKHMGHVKIPEIKFPTVWNGAYALFPQSEKNCLNFLNIEP